MNDKYDLMEIIQGTELVESFADSMIKNMEYIHSSGPSAVVDNQPEGYEQNMELIGQVEQILELKDTTTKTPFA